MLTWAEMVVAHFPFHTTRIDAVPAGYYAFLNNFVEDRFVEGFSLLRGE
jgi:hypothetical protein